MKFKEGDRVHVTKLDNMKVDFYATLNSANLVSFKLEDCSNSSHEEKSVWKVVTNNSCDYYVLAEDEEDTKGGNNMPTIKRTRESIAELEQEREQFKKQRDSLIKDVEKLREEKAATEMYLDAIKTYKPMYECVNDKYKYLTNYIKDKALHNPSVSRYIDLVHVIDELERDSHEG